MPGFICPSGSQIALNSRKAPISSGPNIFGSSSAARLAVAVLARDDAAVGDDEVADLVDERAVVGEPAGLRRPKLMRQWTRPWPKWPYLERVVAVAVQQVLEAAQVGAEMLGRDRGVLPALVVVAPPGR